jgi:GGDEF domain-containing protein
LVDPLEFTLFNMRYGFEAGDAALKAMVAAMKQECPTAKVVRLHTDGFAMVFGPTSEARVQPSLVEPVRRAMQKAVEAVTPVQAEPKQLVVYTMGCFELTVVDPPNWQVLGPLVWAECERALVIIKRQPYEGVLSRTVALHGRLPEFE